jgi:Protein of unknown function (DUF3147)
MSGTGEEATVTERVSERPELHPGKVSQVRPRDLAYRFLAGAATSVVAGLVTLWLGPRTGGILLAFPAILAASLTLIEEQEDSKEAREDARGAIVGGVGLAVFAVVVASTVRSVGGGASLALATGAWFTCALGGYVLAWFR